MKLFGFGARSTDAAREASASDLSSRNAPTVNHANLGEDGRSDLINQIGDFLLCNTLSVSPRNLVIAHGIFSGSNLSLARKVFRRQMEGLPIDQKWLDAALDDSGQGTDAQAEYEKFRARFENSLDKFSDTARKASEATSDYTSALERTARDIETSRFTVNDLSALAGLNRSMIERTRLLEENMQAGQAEVAKLKRNLEVARQDADTDALTGLANRRAFEQGYARVYREARAAIDSLSVAFCDIDHFKRINDTHGHDTGDRVIQAIAELLSTMASDTCHVSRHGGEEFVLLFRGLTPTEALSRIDHARELFAARNLINKETEAPIGKVTFSGGVADVFAFADSRAALKAADDALYQAKEAGRNQILIATPGSSPS